MRHLAAAILLAAAAAVGDTPLDRVPAEVPDDWVWVTVHRSARTMAPENTLASTVHCFVIGADCADNDLWLTVDGHLILFHDYSTALKAGGYWPIGELTLSEVRELDAGSAMYPDHAGQGIPRFEEVLRFAVPNGLRLFLDYKDETTRVAADSVLALYDALPLSDWDRQPRMVTYNDKIDADRLAIARALVRRPPRACAVRVDDPRVTLALLGRDTLRAPYGSLEGPPAPDHGPDASLDALIAALADSSNAGRLAALVIARDHAPEAAAALSRVLGGEGPAAVHAAVHAAWGLGELKGSEAVDALLHALDREETVTQMAAYSLGRIKAPRSARPLQGLVDRTKSDRVAGAAAWALGEIGDTSSVDVLHAALGRLTTEATTETVGAATHVAVALGKLSSPASVAPLHRAATTPGFERIGDATALALGRIGTSAAVDAILDLHTRRIAWGQMAVRALVSCRETGHLGLVSLISSPDQEAAMDAVLALMNEPLAAPVVARLLRGDASNLVRTRAALVLGYTGSDAQIDALSEALDSPDLVLRDQAAWSLERIGTPGARAALAASSHPRSFVNAQTIDATWRQLVTFWDANLEQTGGAGRPNAATLRLRATNPLDVPVLQTVSMDFADSPWSAFYRPKVSLALGPGESELLEFTVWHSGDARPDSLPPVTSVLEIQEQPFRLLGPTFEHAVRFATPPID